MKIYYTTALLLAFTTKVHGQNESSESLKTSTQTSSSGKKLIVSVYYETLRGDSRRFIKNQLYPVLKNTSLSNYFEADLVPYGKATTTKSSNSSSFSFTCHHGDEECEGNKMHACALKHIESYEDRMALIYCSMASKYPPGALESCSTELGLSNVDKISSCPKGEEGSELLNKNGERTQGLKPKLYSVPWITYDGGFSEGNLRESQKDFKAVLCKELMNKGVNPDECGSS